MSLQPVAWNATLTDKTLIILSISRADSHFANCCTLINHSIIDAMQSHTGSDVQ
jgi:hypothetical protein